MTKKDKKKSNNWSRREKETLFAYFRRVLSANWLQVLIGFLSLLGTIVSIYLMWPERLTEEEKLNNSITIKLALVEETLYPDSIKWRNDTTGEKPLIYFYEREVKDYCTLYKVVSKYKYNELENPEENGLTYFYQFKNNNLKLLTKLIRLKYVMGELLEYSQTVEDSEYLMFDFNEFNRLDILLEQNKEFAESNDPTQYFNNKEYIKGLNILEKINRGEIPLRLQECFLNNVINMNNIVNLRLSAIN